MSFRKNLKAIRDEQQEKWIDDEKARPAFFVAAAPMRWLCWVIACRLAQTE